MAVCRWRFVDRGIGAVYNSPSPTNACKCTRTFAWGSLDQQGRVRVMQRISTGVFLRVLLCVAFGSAVFAQSVSQISGTVKDASGLAVPDAQVTVTQTDTGATRATVSAASGAYSLPALPIGPYRMEVKKEGFSTFVQTGIVLQVDTAPTIDPVLMVGAVSQAIEVEAAATMVESHSSGVGQVVNQQQVVE